MARDRVAVGAKAEMNRELVDGAMKAARVIGAGAFVERRGEQSGESGLFGRVLRRAAANGEFERDERHGVAFDEPDLQAAGRHDPLHMFSAGGDGDGGRVSGHLLS